MAVSEMADLRWLDFSIVLIENWALPLLVSVEFFSQEEILKTASRLKTSCIDLIKVFIFLRF
jgi:hypothetical protein